MRIIDIIQTAQSNLQRAKVRTFLTILAVFIGTFTLTMTTAVTEGVRNYIFIQIHAYGEANSIIIMPKGRSDGTAILSQSDVDTVKSIPNITSAYPAYTVSIDYAQYNNTQIKASLDALYPDTHPSLIAGNLFSTNDTSSIIIPYDALSSFGLASPEDAIGRVVTIHLSQISPKGVSGQQTPLSKTDTLTIKGVIANSIHGQPGFVSYNLMKELSYFQNQNKDVFKAIYGTTTTNLSSSDQQTLKDTLNQKGYTATTFQDLISRLNQVITLGQLGTAAFAGIALLVACICIINTLFMAILERTQEIGLLKALGMQRRGIFAIFALEATSIGFWGGVIGVGLALALGPILNRVVNHLVPDVGGVGLLVYPPVLMIAIILGGMIIGFLSGIIPAIRASRLDPIVALRHE